MKPSDALVEEAREFYSSNMKGCYRPATGEEPRLDWLIAAFTASLLEAQRREIADGFERELFKIRGLSYESQVYNLTNYIRSLQESKE